MLRDYTSLKIGGVAEYLIIPDDTLTLKNLIDLLKEEKRDYLLLGSGTNVLIKDSGVDEVVINLKRFQKHQVVKDEDDEICYFAQAGVSLQSLVRETIKRGFTGMEGLVGIPGTIGGALFGNAGAYGYEIMDIVDRVTIMREGLLTIIKKEELDYGYRIGGFAKGDIILGVHLLLKKGDPEEIKERAEEFLKEKKNTQPIGERSAGCVFKNPGEVSAGKLIEESQCKGMRVGDIEVSRIHGNFFINKGSATAADFIKLMEIVSERVFKDHGIILEPEIRIYGRD
jgi:UDP-N-acetylmuramate dehydrogenase